MSRWRRTIMEAALAVIGLLAVLSILGAFLGADRAAALFNWTPLAVFWFLLAALLVLGLVAFKRLLRSPGLLAMHLGSLLVLGGAMWGSKDAHALRARWLGSTKTPSGYMVIYEGEATDTILGSDLRTPIGKTAFRVGLRDFRIEYYPAPDRPWQLIAISGPEDEGGERREAVVAWTPGQSAPVPFTPLRLRVIQYLPNARPTYAEGAGPSIRVTAADGRQVVLPAEPGREVALTDPPVKVRVVQVFANVQVRGAGPDREVLDAGGPPVNPAVKVEIERDGRTTVRYLLPQLPTHGGGQEDVVLRFVAAKPSAAAADPASDAPAMEVLLEHDGQGTRRWLIPQGDESHAGLPLGPILARTPAGEAAQAEGPELYLVQPTGEVRDYLSDLVVLEGDQEKAHQVIEVNQPLHYGGYHFYQHSYDSQAERYTVLGVVSDSGLAAVYAGFFLVVAAIVAQLWIGSAWGGWKGQGGRGN